jgi:uncharacterized 2Fe-2S/4Fe-4S cluster protein (DUF4445 family)
MSTGTVQINVRNRTIRIRKGVNLFEALMSFGLMLRSDCGGHGRCGKCRVIVGPNGKQLTSQPDETERKILKEEGLVDGFRLSCRTQVYGDIDVEIPEESLLKPEVVKKDLPILLPRIEILKSVRYKAVTSDFGVAVDIGTTTIAVYLCNLEMGTVVGSTSVRNPQAIFGADVISRISALRTVEEGLERLQKMVVWAIDWAISAMSRRLNIDPKQISYGTVVGNSTMIHILLGEDPSSIGTSPYTPRFTEDRIIFGGSIGFSFNPKVKLHTLPLISGFLGADLIAAALAVNISKLPPGSILVDVGTNGEIIFVSENGFSATSCATGPALEGACIRHGMQAVSGAIDAVRFDPRSGCLEYNVIQRDMDHPQLPSGICGSGVISTIAELFRVGVILKTGRIDSTFKSPCLLKSKNGTAQFEVASKNTTKNGAPILISQEDVGAVQLAKSALRTGIELLRRENKTQHPLKILLAGAFGSFINKIDMINIGIFPKIPVENIEVVGNAAGVGAILSLFNDAYIDEAREIAKRVKVFDIAAHQDFQHTFTKYLWF